MTSVLKREWIGIRTADGLSSTSTSRNAEDNGWFRCRSIDEQRGRSRTAFSVRSDHKDYLCARAKQLRPPRIFPHPPSRTDDREGPSEQSVPIMSSPIDSRDHSDPGDQVIRKFRYQHAYGVVLAILMMDQTPPYRAICVNSTRTCWPKERTIIRSLSGKDSEVRNWLVEGY